MAQILRFTKNRYSMLHVTSFLLSEWREQKRRDFITKKSWLKYEIELDLLGRPGQ